MKWDSSIKIISVASKLQAQNTKNNLQVKTIDEYGKQINKKIKTIKKWKLNTEAKVLLFQKFVMLFKLLLWG